jgi:ABC-type thiamin/hydroxymethylpyrimidine transport system permease subunit
MILLYVLFFLVGVVVFLLTPKLALIARLGIALGVFLLPSIVATIWIIKVGDKAPSDARTIYPAPEAQPSEKSDEKPKS